jgi:hypothetical protein
LTSPSLLRYALLAMQFRIAIQKDAHDSATKLLGLRSPFALFATFAKLRSLAVDI